MDFRILGPLEVVDGDRILRLGSGKQLALVAVLLLRRNEVVSVDRLVDELWGESPPATAAKIVRNAVSLLRRELADRLVTQAPGYLLRVEPGELDSERLERAVGSADLVELNDALALSRGRPLAQFADEPFAAVEVARLEEVRLLVLEARIDADLAAGGHEAVVHELEALLHQHPLRERLAAQLMLALYRSGRQAEALDVYQRTRRNLDGKLGIEPGPALRGLERKILNQDESLGPPSPAEPPSTARRRWPRALAVAGILLAAAAVAILLSRDAAGGLGEVPPNYVGVIDPARNEILAAVPVGARPGPIAAGGNAVWVGNLDDRTLTRIDLRRRTRTAYLSLGGRTPTGLAASPDAVWVSHGQRGEVTRIDAQFPENRDVVAVTTRPYGTPYGSVTLFAGDAWAAFGDSTLARIDAETRGVVGSTVAGSSPTALTGGRRSVWVASSGDATVLRFAPATFEEGPIRAVGVGRRPTSIAFGEGAVWVANLEDDTVTRIDPETHSTFTIPVGDEPVAVAVGAGAVWVASAGARTVSRIDPAQNEVVATIGTSNPPAGIVVAGGSVWVTVQAP